MSGAARGVERWARDAFAIPSDQLAPALLGQVLVRMLNGRRLAGRIVETEAYMGALDLAAHTAGGRRTPRNEVMYGPAGHAYVYFTYGMHHCFNIVSGHVGEGVAVLIRALEPLEGLEEMRALRLGARSRALRDRDLASGPAKLCQAMRIDRRQNGLDLCESGELFLERAAWRPGPGEAVVVGPRIGIGYAGDWVDRPLRWRVAGNPHVSSG